jgi:hypothetical protein
MKTLLEAYHRLSGNVVSTDPVLRSFIPLHVDVVPTAEPVRDGKIIKMIDIHGSRFGTVAGLVRASPDRAIPAELELVRTSSDVGERTLVYIWEPQVSILRLAKSIRKLPNEIRELLFEWVNVVH